MTYHSNFVHLHVHSYYSLLDGAAPVHVLASRARELKMPAMAITDHGNIFGAIEFYETLSKAGVKPCIGCEVYMPIRGTRFDRGGVGETALAHLVLLIKNHTGYKNLCKLITSSYLEGFYYKPRIDKDILREHNEGLIALSACMKGEVPRAIMENRWEDAVSVAKEFSSIFTDERFYLELMDQSLPDQPRIREGLIKLGKELSLPLVATNDVHYIMKENAEAQDVLMCIQTGKTVAEAKRLRLGSNEFYLKTAEEMAELFSDCPEAISNTLAISEKLNLEFDFNTYHFPKFATPEGKDLAGYLGELSREGFAKRWAQIEIRASAAGKPNVRALYEKRLEDELKMILDMGFAGYFLIVADFISYAKSNDLPVGPGRGSAAGSLVAYCLGITNIDPIEHGLLFERFLNPERISMPDVDIDFCMRRRPEVIEYVAKKYGNVSQIITFGSMKARAVVRDVGRSLGMAYGDVDKIAKLIPATLGMTLAKAIEIEPKLKELSKQETMVKKLLEIAASLEGFPRHASTHAAGVVISDRPLDEFVPLYKGSNGDVVTQFDMKYVEKVGLIKFDFLGLKTLTVIDDCLKLLEKRAGKKIDIDNIPLNDPLIYKELSAGDTAGIFQLESSGMTDLVMKLKPETFEDIVALVALFRPGPLGSGMVDDFINRKHKRIEIRYELPELEGVLRDTYGVIVYQEQVMRIANMLANFSLGEADILRRAMGKKKPEEMAKQKERFLHGAVANKISKPKAEKIFDLMAKFAEYGFNKCVVKETELIDALTGEIFTVGDVVQNGPGRTTFSCDKKLNIVPGKIVDVLSNGKKEVFLLETHLGHHIRVTNNHPFLTMDGWKTLADLKAGDRIATPRILPVEGKLEWPVHEVVSLAWLLSEGNTCHPSSLYFYNNDRSLVDDFISHIEKFPHTKARAYLRRKTRWEVCANTGVRLQAKVALMKGHPKRSGAFVWAEHLGLTGKKASEKFIPEDVFKLKNDQLALFIGRLWSGDGFIFSNNNSVPFYATSSEKMARQLAQLLLRFGIISRIARKAFRYKGGIKKGYAVYLTGENSVRSFLDRIGPSLIGRDNQICLLINYLKKPEQGHGCRDTIPWEIKNWVRDEKISAGKTWVEVAKETELCMREFYDGFHLHKRGFRRETISKLGKYFHSDGLINLARSDIYWDEVKVISREGKKETYDLTMEKEHNFVANGIIVHNSHSAAYALVAYQTAYLKAHHPTEFMASLLTTEKDNTDKILDYINDCKTHGIKILPPDVNESARDFSVISASAIRFGLAAVKNVGDAAIESIVAVRDEKGPYRSLFDFCERIDARKVNKRVLESLIKCGAFDFTKAARAALLASLDRAMDLAASVQRDRLSGQSRLFDMASSPAAGETLMPELPDVSEWGERQLLAYEKESLGFYITGHPLAAYEPLLKQYATVDTANLGEVMDNQEVKLGGVVAKIREITTKRGDLMGFASVEDLKGSAEVVVFSDVYAKANALLKSDQPIFVVGNADTDGENVKIIAREIVPLEDVPELMTKSIHFYLHEPEMTANQIAQLKNVISRYLGNCPGFVHLVVPEKAETVLKLPQELKLKPSPELVQAVEKLFGHNVTKFMA